MVEKKTHFGRAGEFFAMSELLLRGWNVAVPVVDIGDDVFVINDNDKTIWRVQVKSTGATKIEKKKGPSYCAKFQLSRQQLKTPKDIELFYMLLVRFEEEKRWRFLIIPRVTLEELRQSSYIAAPKAPGPGKPPKTDDNAKVDKASLSINWAGEEVKGWNVSLNEYLDQWPGELSVLSDGPGSISED